MRRGLRTRAADYGPQVRNRLQKRAGLRRGGIYRGAAMGAGTGAGRPPWLRSEDVDVVLAPALALSGADHRRKPISAALPDAEQAIQAITALHAAGETFPRPPGLGRGQPDSLGRDLPIGMQLNRATIWR